MESGIKQAIQKIGRQNKLAKAVGVTPQALQHWIKSKKVPAKRVLAVEKLTGVSRTDLNPDIYPKEGV